MTHVGSTYAGLEDRAVLVTGGASGIGEALVAAFVMQGAKVAFLDIDDAAGRARAAGLAGHRHQPVFRHCDLTDDAALEGAVSSAINQLGGLDILVNNAGNDDRHAVATITPSYWRARMAVNLDHYFFSVQAALPALRASAAGCIINLGSTSWRLKLPNLLVYQTAKAAIEGLTRALARDLGPDGIRVNAILPGAVETPRQARWESAGNVAETVKAQCLNLRIQPAAVAALALFLASTDARACTGQNFVVDAGLT